MSYNSTELRTIQRHRAIIETVPSPKSGLVYPAAIRLDTDTRQTVLDQLDPTVSNPDNCGSLCKSFISNLETAHQAATEARLRRVADQDTATPFEVITDTELAYGFSSATLSSAKLVSEKGVGIMHTALDGLLREAGLSPNEVLPPSIADPIISTDSVDDSIDHADITSRSELKSQSKQAVQSLRHQLKYIRDCAFIRTYYNDLTNELNITQCPKITWKQAAVNVQNDVDPFAQQNKADGDEPLNGDIDWFSHKDQLSQFSADSDEDESTESSSQTGLDQF